MDNLAQEAIKAKNALNQLSHSQLKDRDAKNIVMQSESNLPEELDKFVSELEEVELSIEISAFFVCFFLFKTLLSAANPRYPSSVF